LSSPSLEDSPFARGTEPRRAQNTNSLEAPGTAFSASQRQWWFREIRFYRANFTAL